MKAISIWQPYASLLVKGVKKIETRGWRPKSAYLGTLAIQACHPQQRKGRYSLDNILDSPPFDVLCAGMTLPVGMIIGTVKFSGVRPVEEMISTLTPLELSLGDYSPGRLGWIMYEPFELPEPIVCKGKLGFWNVPEDVEEKIREQLLTNGRKIS